MCPSIILFTVYGTPRPGGSKRGFIVGGRVALVDASGANGRNWRQDVKAEGLKAMEGFDLFTGPLEVAWTFHMPRPKYHYYSGKANHGMLRCDAPLYHDKKPDTTKLIRSAEDALTGIVWKDDSQVVKQYAVKCYCEESTQCGMSVMIKPIINSNQPEILHVHD